MPAPLLFSLPMCYLFWFAVWAAPVRAGLGAATADLFTADLPAWLPNWPVVRQFEALCVQRVIARAIVARLAWLRDKHIPLLPRYEQDSAVCWESLAMKPSVWQNMAELDEWELDSCFGLLTEWLLHMLNAPADAVLPALRVAALAGACGRVARVYAEWRRRYGAKRAREVLRDGLRHYVGPQAVAA